MLNTQPAPAEAAVGSEHDLSFNLTVALESNKDSVAVVGMSVKTPGADDLAEYAEMLRSGQFQHVPITRDRLMHDILFREAPDSDPKRQYYGCFVRDSDAFDHKFFKRSPRKSTAMDPQSRLVLEVAYQAVEQSGYFSELDHGHRLGQGTDSDSTNAPGGSGSEFSTRVRGKGVVVG